MTARVLAVELDESAVIETREGTVRANRGDFLVVNEDEKDPHPWPVNREIFFRSYAEVSK